MILLMKDASSHVCWWSLWGPGTSRWWHCRSQTGSVALCLGESSAEGGKVHITFYQNTIFKVTRKPDSSSAVSDTSMTCFLLDLSLEAQSTEPPRRSTVNSGFDWLLPNFWNQGNSMRRHLWHKDDITGTGCGFRRIFMIKNKKSEEVINVKMLENCSGYETKSTTLLLWILFCSSLCTHTSLVWCYQKSRNTVNCYLYHVHINEHTMRLVSQEPKIQVTQ